MVFAAQIQAQGDGEIKYRRSSLYSMMINHEGREFGDEIKDVFLKIPVPDKYNNHDLSVKVIYTSEKKLDKNHEEIDEFIRNNGIASRMVGRWFNRDYMTGICDVELVKERGLYNASELDKALASKTQRGNALLEDAGEDLIGNTFLIVNDIRYIDRSYIISSVSVPTYSITSMIVPFLRISLILASVSDKCCFGQLFILL